MNKQPWHAAGGEARAAEPARPECSVQISEEELGMMLNSIGDAVIATDAQARVTFLNPIAERLTGLTLSEAITLSVEEVCRNHDEIPGAIGSVSLALARGAMQGPSRRTIVNRRDGRQRAITETCTPIRDRNGDITGALLVFRDTSGESLPEQAIRDQATRMQAILNTVADGIITFHADDGLIETANPAAEHMFGYAAGELVGQNCLLLIPETGQDLGDHLHPYDSTNDEPLAFRVGRETIGRRKDGSCFPMEVAMSEMWLHGQRHYAGIFRDITQRNQMDRMLHDNYVELKRAISVAEKANSAKSEFLSRMSHELRTPLNAILGFAQLLESGAPPPTAAQAERLRQITKAGWYLLELINEILDLAVIESGKLALSPEPVALVEVLRECQAMVESQAQKRAIQLNFRPTENALFANADRTRVKQILINLLSNAIKYNSRHGMVEVECTASATDRIRISIRDTGAGLSPKELSQLFQPFNRLGQENGNEEGTGMGLVVARQLVELMGGKIGVKSTVGKGSEFWIELVRDAMTQRAGADARMPEGAAHTRSQGMPRTLLYVEDNPANLMLVEQIVESDPHLRMLSATNGQAGIALARTHRPNVILMDINLPDIGGIEALGILRQDPATTHIPVLALSASAMQRDIEHGLAAGFFRYLTKPIKLNEFIGALDDALALPQAGSARGAMTERERT